MSDNDTKKLSITAFKALVLDDQWYHRLNSEVMSSSTDTGLIYNFETDTYDEFDATGAVTELDTYEGWVKKTAELNGMTIEQEQSFFYVGNMPDSFEVFENEEVDQWRIKGFTVVDDDGAEVDIYQLVDLLPSAFTDFNVDVYDFMGSNNAINTKYFYDNSVMPANTAPIHLKSTYIADVSFIGKLVASADERDDLEVNKSSWLVLNLYKTTTEHYVCERKRLSDSAIGSEINEVVIAPSIDDIKAFFGNGTLAQCLYGKIRVITTSINIDGYVPNKVLVSVSP